MTALLERLNLRFNRSEISGSLGDMGTFLPLVAGLVVTSGMNLGHILFFSGAMHVASGVMFGIPMPVQPMKSIAAIAITEGLSENMILAAGIGAGLILLILALTGTIDILRKYIPMTIVRGLQLAIGLKLFIKGISLVVDTGNWFAVDSILVGFLCFALLMITAKKKKFPGALIVFSIGGVLLLWSKPWIMSNLTLGWELPVLHTPNGTEFFVGFWRGTIPQIPLTILNSVIAVSVLSADLFPERPLNPRRVTISVALMNLIA
ncbi:MAG: molybdate transporter family protein, partial [Planctomycetota bacterium]